jgi:hypothetical protein
MIVHSSKNPIILNEIFGFRRDKKSLNKDNKITPVAVDNSKQEFEEYMQRIPKLSSEEQNKYKAFIGKMLNDIEKTLNKILTKYPKVKDMFSITDLNYIVELNDMINFNEFIYVYLNDESKKDSYVNSYNNAFEIGNIELDYAIDEIMYSKNNTKTYNDIYNDLVKDVEFQKQSGQAMLDIENELSKLGYGKVDIDISKYSGYISISNITQSPKYKQYFK